MNLTEWAGELVKVEFLDHAQDAEGPNLVFAYGRLIQIQKDCIILAAWEDEHWEGTAFSIVTSTIETVTKLKRTKVKRRKDDEPR